MGHRILIVDDHPSFRASARVVLESEGFEVVGEAVDGASALHECCRLRPEVVLLDVQLPDIDGFDVCAADHRVRRAPDRDHDLEPRRLGLRAAGHDLGGMRVRAQGRALGRARAGVAGPVTGLRRALGLVAIEGIVVGLVALAIVLSSDHVGNRAVTATLGLFIGWSFIGAGLFAWWRRPDNRFGVLMTAVGFAFFLGVLVAADSSLLFTVGRALLEPLHRGLRPHAARLSRRADRLAAAAQGARGRLRALDRRAGARAAVRRHAASSWATRTCPTRRSTWAPTR